MKNMYAKLFSRITESSLMEEPINVRYTFVMLLAIADPNGYAIGTDVALSRRLNMPINEFRQCVEILMRPDPDSNSKEEDGRRVIESDGERGYKLVNYMTYREMKDEQERRDYMKDYMRKYREKQSGKREGSSRKQSLTGLTQAEEQVKAEGEEEAKAPVSSFDEFWEMYPKKKGKGDAEKAWSKMRCHSIRDSILSKLSEAKLSPEWRKEGGQFIPHPATWLNRKGWEDEFGSHQKPGEYKEDIDINKLIIRV